MTSFNDREKGFENKFAHDKELTFKITARRNKLLGLWAAEKLGKSGQDAEAYASEVVAADFEKPGDDDVIGKLVADFGKAGRNLTTADIKAEMERLLSTAREQIIGKKS